MQGTRFLLPTGQSPVCEAAPGKADRNGRMRKKGRAACATALPRFSFRPEGQAPIIAAPT
ncbi:hypothetical protein Rsw2DRAFT_0940 [Rhodobacter ferrooxidans]|uniref:Uncharacterized protein n=1 Tax=Rhodobacter ferrooxidans TaxID=371731 RepID=C8RYR2_9RHOB|nr:hypothetical protein Rsw2DRAFT_0940 [Rhodobacter sp. SW2]